MPTAAACSGTTQQQRVQLADAGHNVNCPAADSAADAEADACQRLVPFRLLASAPVRMLQLRTLTKSYQSMVFATAAAVLWAKGCDEDSMCSPES